ncbi:hypothetical protein D7X87_24310 [bacterium D16-54]|nr:hypothetical protein D7X87_24310 [bacterium D16-54]RKJ09774.1 hypothetical protein D7X65_24685 [bacterium D16-56]
MIYSELYQKLGVKNKKISIIKSLIEVLVKNEIIVLEGQSIVFLDNSWDVLQKLWDLFEKTRGVCDYSHMPKLAFVYLFQILYSGMILKEFVTIYGIFCPGYEGKSYKKRLGTTTLRKMENLKHLSKIMKDYEIKHEVICIYADVFLENAIDEIKIHEEFEFNKTLFLQKSLQYFEKTILLSDFLRKTNIQQISFIDSVIVDSFNKQEYERFLDCNMNFYQSMGWDEKRIKKRNDELITLYGIVADKMHKNKNSIYACIENIEGRASLFLNKQIPVFYISKKIQYGGIENAL